MLPCREKVLAWTNRLMQIESIVNTEGEKIIARKIFGWLSDLPYYKKHPTHLILQRTTDGNLERYNVFALVKGKKRKSGRTVILMGHTDTVGTDDFNRLKSYACDPEKLMEALQEEPLLDQAKNHLQSGGWLFGRGILDMKSGLASHLFLIQYYAEHPKELAGNLLLLAECDEEDGSHGVLSALDTFQKLKEEHGLAYIAAINADFVAPRFEGDENRYIYKGTIGKLLPSFYITGAETHVGACFEGLDPNLIAAELTKRIDYNPELCNRAFGETTMPPVSLKQTDLKPSYTVQTALASYVYYNFFSYSWSPKEVLEKLKKVAAEAFEAALATFENRKRRFAEMSGECFGKTSWKPRVLLYEEMENILIAEHGSAFTRHMEDFKGWLLRNKELDTRMFAAKAVEEAWKWMADKSPAIIVFYSSLYSPRVELPGKNEKERALLKALDEAVAAVQPHYPHPIVTRNFFPYISDMSFVAISDSAEEIDAMAKNNPAWGTKLCVDYEKIRALNVPVINIGPYGMDAHKKLERMEMHYSLEIVPNLTNEVILNLLV